jgi:twitching motility protein PilT
VQIDQLLGSIARFGASGAMLTSDEKVMLSFPGGPRYAAQTTPHDMLVRLVEEIMPSGTDLYQKGGTTFQYRNGGSPVLVRVDALGKSWKVAVETLAPLAEAVEISPPGQEPVLSSGLDVEVSTAVDRLLLATLRMGASDLHLSSGCPPRVRVDGKMTILPGAETLPDSILLGQLYEITPERNRREFETRNDTDFGHSIPGVSRFRANLFRDRRGAGGVFRAIPFEILSPEQLGLPPQVLDLCYLTKGLVLVTGPTGSGKSTTLATLIDHINENRSDHIITIEDPIEFVHENKKCLVNQREVHSHTDSFKDALRAALREDPDIVLVGEMRDLETIAIAVETAETGHLVFGTLHTTTAPSTIDRIIDQFPADRQDQIRQMLSTSLKGVIAQTLCPKIGGGRVAAYEILYSTPAVANLIREAKTYQLYSIIQTNRGLGMMTLNDSLMDLVRKKLVEPKAAYMLSVNKTEFVGMLSREGVPTSAFEN